MPFYVAIEHLAFKVSPQIMVSTPLYVFESTFSTATTHTFAQVLVTPKSGRPSLWGIEAIFPLLVGQLIPRLQLVYTGIIS